MAPDHSPLSMAALRRLEPAPPKPATPEPLIQMLMIARRQGKRCAWALCSDDGWSANGLCPPGANVPNAWHAAIEKIVERLGEVQRPVSLEVERRPYRSIGYLLRRVAGIVSVKEAYHHDLFYCAEQVISSPPAPLPPPPPPSPLRPLVIATDGSHRRWHGEGGWAWLDEDGRFRARSMRCPDILVAELVAIYEALRTNRKMPRELVIVSDSLAALACLDPDRYRPGAGDAGPPTRAAAEVSGRIRHMISARGFPVRFIWVRGHAGHPLNDGADRLAVTARRAAGMRRGPAMTATLKAIASEATEAWTPMRKIWWASPEALGQPPRRDADEQAADGG